MSSPVSDFEAKLQMMGFEMDGEHTATADLTPYKQRDRARKEEEKAGEGKPPLPPPTTNSHTVRVEEKKVTSVTFNDKDKVTVHRYVQYFGQFTGQ